MRLLVAFVLFALASPAYAIDDVPEPIQGKWANWNEACDTSNSSMVISASSIVYADGMVDEVYFSPGEKIIRTQEGKSYEFEYLEADDILLFHSEGRAIGSAPRMKRCPETAAARERRCGWLANLTEGNWWLVDADRTWVLAKQGDDSAAAIAVTDAMPSFDRNQFVSTGRYYGYGCACLTVATDASQSRITAISSSQRLPLAKCRADASLSPLKDWQ